MTWAIYHDPSPIVRAEAISAVSNLNIITEDESIREALFTAKGADKSEKVRHVAEKSLIEHGCIGASAVDNELAMLMQRIETSTGNNNANGQGSGYSKHGAQRGVYSHILQNATDEDTEIFLRESLVEEKECNAAIAQVRQLSNKDVIMGEVEHLFRMSEYTNNDMDQQFEEDFHPKINRRRKVRAK